MKKNKTVNSNNHDTSSFFPIKQDKIESLNWIDDNRFTNYNQTLRLPSYKNFSVFVAKNDLSDDVFFSLFVVNPQNKILDSLKIAYVEDGYPESDSQKIIKFNIEKDYKISLNKYNRDGYKNIFESEQKYEISEKGLLEKIN